MIIEKHSYKHESQIVERPFWNRSIRHLMQLTKMHPRRKKFQGMLISDLDFIDLNLSYAEVPVFQGTIHYLYISKIKSL